MGHLWQFVLYDNPFNLCNPWLLILPQLFPFRLVSVPSSFCITWLCQMCRCSVPCWKTKHTLSFPSPTPPPLPIIYIQAESLLVNPFVQIFSKRSKSPHLSPAVNPLNLPNPRTKQPFSPHRFFLFSSPNPPLLFTESSQSPHFIFLFSAPSTSYNVVS